VTTAGAYAMQSAYFFKSAAIVANCESAASKSSTVSAEGSKKEYQHCAFLMALNEQREEL
jgi:hypothetical protein